MLDRSFLDRFLAAPLDADIRAWALALMFESLSPNERRHERDRWIRAAAALVPGRAWTRARRLHAMATELARAMPARPELGTARGCLVQALLVCPGRIPSLKTFGRIVDTIA